MDDALDLAGQGLTIFAVWLDRVSAVPWPLVVGMLFLPLVVVLRWTLWFLRGSVWLVPCKYFHTLQARSDKPCRVVVAGEWGYCRHHKHHRTMSDGHVCDPSIPRWQARRQGKVMERHDVRGVGFVALLSNRETLLFYKGIAKRPAQVWHGLPHLPRQFLSGFRALRQLSWKDVVHVPDAAPLGTAQRMPRVVRATRCTLIAFILGLVLVMVSVLTPGGSWRRSAQYGATAAFFLAWSALHLGIWKDPHDEPHWVRAVVINTAKAVATLVIVALATGALTGLGTSIEKPPSANFTHQSPGPRVSSAPSQPGP